MSGGLHLALVAGLAVLACAVAGWLVRRLRRRDRPSLRSKVLALLGALIGVELATLPAVVVAVFPETLFGAPGSGSSTWLVMVAYGGLAVFAFARLFPWREVEALAADPQVSLKEVLARIRDGE